MKKIEVTKKQVVTQIENDRQMMEDLNASCEPLGFYATRIAQSEAILANGHGIFSIFRNEEVEIILK